MTIVDVGNFWIICKQPAFLSSFSPLCQCVPGAFLIFGLQGEDIIIRQQGNEILTSTLSMETS